MSEGTLQTRREHALSILNSSVFIDDREPFFCAWQGETGIDVAAYCNINSYMETLCDLLEHGRWVDDVRIDDLASLVDDRAEAVFRYYGLVFLVLAEVFADIRLLHSVAKTRGNLSAEAQHFLGLVNEVWKHRDGSRVKKFGRIYHRDFHHGLFIFDDAMPEVAAESVPRILSVDNLKVSSRDLLGLRIPSLSWAFQTLASDLTSIGSYLDQEKYRQNVTRAWATPEVRS